MIHTNPLVWWAGGEAIQQDATVPAQDCQQRTAKLVCDTILISFRRDEEVDYETSAHSAGRCTGQSQGIAVR